MFFPYRMGATLFMYLFGCCQEHDAWPLESLVGLPNLGCRPRLPARSPVVGLQGDFDILAGVLFGTGGTDDESMNVDHLTEFIW